MGSRKSISSTTSTTTTATSSSKLASENGKSATRTTGNKRHTKQSTDHQPELEPEPIDEIDSEEEEYEVESIVAHKKTKSGQLQFLLKWKNYPDSDNTWEAQSDLNCIELVQQYLRDHNLDRKGNPIKSAEATSNRKRVSSSASNDIPATKKVKPTTSSPKSNHASPKSQNQNTAPQDLDQLEIEKVSKLNPDLESWEDLLYIETIGLGDDDGGHYPTREDHSQLLVYGLDLKGARVCESLQDVRIKAPQRLLDFLLDHLKFRP